MEPSEEEVVRVAQALSSEEWDGLKSAALSNGYVKKWDDPLIERGLLRLDDAFQRIYLTPMGVRVLEWSSVFALEPQND